MLYRRKQASPNEQLRMVQSGDDEFFGHFPALWEFLTATVWPGSTDPRQPGSILMFVQDGLLKVRLMDPNTNEMLWLAYQSLWEALQGADQALAEGKGEWRVQRPYKGQQKK